jgi:hypothetical protein
MCGKARVPIGRFFLAPVEGRVLPLLPLLPLLPGCALPSVGNGVPSAGCARPLAGKPYSI